MESIVSLLSALSAMSPLAVVALLGVVLLFAVKNQKQVTAISDNHLSGLPELEESMRRMEFTLQRIEVKLGEDLSWIRAKLGNGGSHK